METKKAQRRFDEPRKITGDYVNFHKASDLLPQQDEQDTKLSSIITKAE